MERHIAHAAANEALGELEDLAVAHEPSRVAEMYGSIIGYVLAFDPNALWDAILRYRASTSFERIQPPLDPPNLDGP